MTRREAGSGEIWSMVGEQLLAGVEKDPFLDRVLLRLGGMDPLAETECQS